MMLALALLVASTLAPPPVQPVPAQPLPWPAPGGSWRSLRMEAKKAIFKASVDVRVERRSAEAALSELREWPESGARKPVGETAVFTLETKASFRGEGERVTWADAWGLLQDDSWEGKRRSERRFGTAGYHQVRERGKNPASERIVSFDATELRPVVDMAFLLWLASGLRLDREGARLEVAVVTRGSLVPLELEAKDLVTVGEGRSSVQARRVLIRSQDEEHDASFFGLHGDVDLLLDTATGLPVEMRGHVKKVGAVRVRVVSVEPEPAEESGASSSP